MRSEVLIVDFGSQYTQLIARRVRELNIFCEIYPYNRLPSSDGFGAVILSGSPCSVLQPDAPCIDLSLFRGKIPILGICYGAQYIAQDSGGVVSRSRIREYGRSNLYGIKKEDCLFQGVNEGSRVWMSHGDTIERLAENAVLMASTEDVTNVAYRISGEHTYGIQFHPEVYHSDEGIRIIENFLVKIAGVKQDWTSDNFVEETVTDLRQKLKRDKVILGLSGGVDSTVAAVLLNKAIGDGLHCVFIDNGLLRKGEYEDVLRQYEDMKLNITGVDATDDFMEALSGISDPEKKRKVIGRTFVEVFDREAQKISDVRWLGQGTIYPDVIESVSVNGTSVTIKSHHNVGGLPEEMNLGVVEPLRMLFKDEVRNVGVSLGISDDILGRHPFPGPGLAVRILGGITRDKVKILQEADDIFIKSLKKEGLYDKIWQAGVISLPVNSVGVMGDERTYEGCVALRAVESVDGMTADWVNLPHRFLQKVSNDIINKVKGINRVVYDISSKPPATIEWE